MTEENVDQKHVHLDYREMIHLIDNVIGSQITDLLMKTESPFAAIATLGAVIASVVTSIVDDHDKAIENIDGLADFARVLTQGILDRQNKQEKGEDEVEDGETLH